MTSRRSAAFLVVLAALAVAGPARAQGQDQPTSLLPSFLGAGRPEAAPNPLGSQLSTPQTLPPPPLPAPPAGGTLGTLPAGTLGTIPSTALPSVRESAVGTMLERIEAPLPAPALQQIARELLLDRAVTGASDSFARARAFYALGWIEEAAGAVVERAPATIAERALAARALIALGHDGQACERADVADLPKNAEPGPTFELLEILALCKLDLGAGDAARLIGELIRDQGGGDALFRALLNAAIGGGAARLPGRVERVRPIHLALMRRVGLALSAELAARTDLALAPVIARDDRYPHEARIVAAERAVAAGLVPGDRLIDLYIATPLEEQLLMQAATGKAPKGALARAHLFALVAEAPTDAERLGFASQMYAQGVEAGVGAAIAEALGEDLAGVIAEPALGRFARVAIEILVRADRARLAVTWVDAGDAPGLDGAATFGRVQSHMARALVAVAAPELGLGVAAGALGSDVGAIRIKKGERAFIASESALMAALGDHVPPLLFEIAGQPTGARPAGGGPVAVLGALAPLAGVSLERAGDEPIAAAVAALAGYGALVEARRLAVEALIARTPD